jgi:hypothetical protein
VEFYSALLCAEGEFFDARLEWIVADATVALDRLPLGLELRTEEG